MEDFTLKKLTFILILSVMFGCFNVANAETTKEIIPAIDTSIFVTKDDLKNVVTKTELDSLKETIAELKKQVKISQILSEKPIATTKGE